MAKNAGDKTWKITEAQRQRAEDEQTKIKRSARAGLTQAQFFGILLEKYGASSHADPLHALLDEVLASGDQAVIQKVEAGLQTAVNAIRRRAGGAPPQKQFYKLGKKPKGDPEREE